MKRIALLALVMNGCASASMVTAPGRSTGSAYAPVNEGARPAS